MKVYTCINQCLKSCLVKVSFRSIENCWFWSTLKTDDFIKRFFFHMPGTLCTRVLYEGIKLELWNCIHIQTKVWSRASSRFHFDRSEIVDSGAFENGGHLVFSWGNVSDNIRYYHLNMCVCGRKSPYALALRVAKQLFNLIIVLCRSVSNFFNDRTSCGWIKQQVYFT